MHSTGTPSKPQVPTGVSENDPSELSGNANSHNGRSEQSQERREATELLQQGKLDEAVVVLRKLLDRTPADFDSLHDLAVVQAKQGKLDDAIVNFERAVKLAPGASETHRNLAVAFVQRGKKRQAEAAFRRAIELNPDSNQARHELANLLRGDGRLEEAVAQYRELVSRKPDFAVAHHDLGLALAELKRWKEAEASYREALRLNPDFPEARNNLGILLGERGAHDEAIACYRESLRIKPSSEDTLNNLGVALAGQRKYDEAVGVYRQALAINPNAWLVLNNLGNSLRSLGQIDESISCLQKALRLRPDYAEAYNNLGIAQVQLGRLDEALENYNRALCFRPDYPEAHLNRSLNWLVRGEFEQGWEEYEWRWRGKGIHVRSYRQPQWDGSPLDGKRMLIYFEQGMGDTLQFIRYARFVQRRGATVIAEVQKPLLPCLARCEGVDEWVGAGDGLPQFDVHIPLLSLPGILGMTLDSVPADVPYLFADPALVERWKERLAAECGDKFKVGIAWQGNPQYRGDRQRSIALSQFEPLARVPDVELISLQKGLGSEQVQEVAADFFVRALGPLDEESGAFMDTAAIMKNLDLMITSDTAIAHLAGALGIPVWIALPFAPDWRWLRDREDTPWYPSATLFRQGEPENWIDVFERMAARLGDLAKSLKRPIHVSLPDESMEAESHYLEGNRRAQAGELEQAVRSFEEAIRRKPDHATAHGNLGVVLAQMRRLRQAVASFHRALEIKPAFGDAYGNLGLAYFELGEFEKAVPQFQRALENGCNTPETHNNLGATLMQLGKPRQAEQSYRRALTIRPDYADAHLNLSRTLLIQGDFGQGWQECEWRKKCRGWLSRNFRQPQFSGGPLAGRTILVYAEQGLGDTLQFVRYASVLRASGGKVVLECQPPLAKLLQTASRIDRVIPAGADLPDFDVHAPLLSLPALLKTTAASIPAQTPYLHADPRLVEYWRMRLGLVDGFKVGIAWQGNPAYDGDVRRSIPLIQFEPLAKAPGVRLVNLQNGAGAEQLVGVVRRFSVIDFGPHVDGQAGAFMDTAAIMQNLDLIVTSDTAIAHLAGALGRPVWLILPFAPDCRWLLDRSDSPWYPTMRIFRQRRPGEWEDVFRDMADALHSLAPPTLTCPAGLAESNGKSSCTSKTAKSRGVARELPAFSVIVPVHDNEATIKETLSSLEASIDCFRHEHPSGREVDLEIVVVDDGSTDRTLSVVQEFADRSDFYTLVRRAQSSSPSCARNTGVKNSKGELLFFLDGDDLYLPRHIIECYRALEDCSVDYVKTAIRLSDPVHTDWAPRIAAAIPLNLCIRRSCHELIGGFPDYHLFVRAGDVFQHEKDLSFKNEDMFYSQMVTKLLAGKRLACETVKYCRHPGNHLDRQYEKFCQPYGACSEVLSEDEQFGIALMELIVKRYQNLLELRRADVAACVR